MTDTSQLCRIDESLPLKPVRIAILTVSDTRDEEATPLALSSSIAPRVTATSSRRAPSCATMSAPFARR